MSCSCSIEYYDAEPNDLYRDKIVVARKEHVCGECRKPILPGDRYEYVVAMTDGDFFTAKTCLLCKEVRDCFCCSWRFEEIWNDIRSDVWSLNLHALENLSKEARDKFFEEVDLDETE